MRSSKKRSRSNQNRPRTLGNIINRVFDSSGPEGKVRGTPQQIIEKYQMLARDAQLSNDRVAAENFLQHAEHYTRMLAEAMKEMAAEQEARQQQYQQTGGQNGGQNGNQNGGQNGPRGRRAECRAAWGPAGRAEGQPRGDRPDRQDRQDRQDRGDRPDRGGPGSRPTGNVSGATYNRDYRAERDLGSEDQPVIVDVIDLEMQAMTPALIATPESGTRARVEPEAHQQAPRRRVRMTSPKPPSARTEEAQGRQAGWRAAAGSRRIRP